VSHRDARGQSTAVIDVHAHTIPQGLIDAARAGRDWHGVAASMDADGRIWCEAEGRRSVLPWSDPTMTYETRIGIMDDKGVDVEVLSHSPLLYWYGLDAGPAIDMAQEINDTLAGVVAAHPSRFHALAYLPLQDPVAAAEEVRRAVGTLGLAGIAIGTHVAGTDWHDRDLQVVLEAAVEVDAFVLLHPSAARFPTNASPFHLRNVIGNPLETTVAVASLMYSGAFDRLPDLTMALAHGGGYTCMGLGRFDHAARVRKECKDIAALPSDYAQRLYFDSLTHVGTSLRFLIDAVGIDRVMLGTDYPADMEQPDPVRFIASCEELSEDERLAVLGRNALRVLGDKASAFMGA
jgi:aminocarboxymuconate-semialdehyde decarboxylase